MTALIPNRFLFSFEFPLRYRQSPPTITGKLSDWTDEDRLPELSGIDGRAPFGTVWSCWNEDGLNIACRVTDKRKPPKCDAERFWKSDNLRLCIDTRGTRDIRRATRFCQQFFLMPTGSLADRDAPVAASAKIHRAREDAPPIPVGRIAIASRVQKGGYQLEAHIPADALSGFDPREHPRIGFYYILEDREHGQQYLTIGDDLNWHIDPSTWATAVLTR